MPSQQFWQRGIAVLADRTGSIAGAFLLVSIASPTSFAQSAPTTDSQPGPSLSLDLDVIARQLDVARNQIQPSLGASFYEFRREAIENQPQGDQL